MITTKRFNYFEEKTYIVSLDDKSCVIVDPGCMVKEQAEMLEALKDLKVEAILLTHAHLDHLFGASFLVEQYGCPVYLDPKEKAQLPHYDKLYEKLLHIRVDHSFPTIDIEDGQVISHAGLHFKVITTPGHSAGGVCYLCEQLGCIFTGDTLFYEVIGRTDLSGGDYDELIRSIMEKLIFLDPELEIYPGHGRPTTIAHERSHNPFLEPFNEPEETIDINELEPIIINH